MDTQNSLQENHSGINPENLLDYNKRWAQGMLRQDPEFFHKLAMQQNPEYLWIGCSDSRVPANQIVGLMPGELFVHRNIANLVVHTDLNCLSVLQFAVDVLKVKHIIVCGHHGCSGVSAALSKQRIGLADIWLRHLQDVEHKHTECLGHHLDDQERLNRLCEINVIEQVANVARTAIVQDAWQRKQALSLHGWVYGLRDGILNDLSVTITNAEDTDHLIKQALSPYTANA